MSDVIKETSPLITPDSLRKINKTNQSFYETHTKKNYGRSDIYGSQYSGTIENFGSEMLIEARKLKTERPSLDGIFEINNFKYYFNLQYSNMIETYNQQGMIEAVLNKDVFLSDKEYTLKFMNCEDVYIPRSEGWGQLHVDPNNPKDESKVYKNKFIHTTTPPVLMIRDIATDVVTGIELKLEIAEDYASDYYFYNEFATQKFISEYEDGTLITTPITNNDAELPFVWICVDIFKSLPPVEFTGNSPEDKPILTIGTDGQKDSHIYPLIYGVDSLPEQSSDGSWFLKAYSDIDGFIPNGGSNYSAKISRIYYTFRPNEGTDIDYQIGFNNEYIKITLSKSFNAFDWDIVHDHLNSPYHAEIPLEPYFVNSPDNDAIILIASFDISFSDEYLFVPYEGLCEGAETGIHVDILSDKSVNAVPKKNGTIHALGDFDGLPSYFKSFHDKTIHRSHVELYAIRDRLNRYTQNTLDKQTAALLLDSGMPQSELTDILTDMKPVIKYQYDPDAFLYAAEESEIVSKNNILSEITYVNDNMFGNSTMPEYADKKKFIYHGNRVFSLGMDYFDPELETARVYYVNNDPIQYVNNANTDKPKPARTIARMCDIPTLYEQLIHVPFNSPTYIFDSQYVRMGSNFDNVDLNKIMNPDGFKIVMTPQINGNDGYQWIYWNEAYLPSRETLTQNGYAETVNIDNPDIPIDNTNFEILSYGTGYSVGDKFYVLVGGVAYDGEVTGVISDGAVSSVVLDIPDDCTVNVYNASTPRTSLKTITVSSETGTNLQLELVINQSDINAHLPQDGTTPQSDLVSFAFDIFGNIFMYNIGTDWTWNPICQVSGTEVVINPYDITNQNERSFNAAFFKLIFDKSYRIDTSSSMSLFDLSQFITEDVIEDYDGARGHGDGDDRSDLSQYIINKNNPNSYYKLIKTSDADNGHFDLHTYEMGSIDGYATFLPRFNRNNTLSYYNPTNRFVISDNFMTSIYESESYQPDLFIYAPKHNRHIDGISQQLMKDRVIITSDHITNLNDYGNHIMESDGRLDANVYYYPEYEFSKEYNDYKQSLLQLQRVDLINIIRDEYGSAAEPLIYEDTEFKYAYEELISYILDRHIQPTYVKGDLKVEGYSGDMSVNSMTGESLLDNPPTGLILPLTSELFQSNVKVNNTSKQESIPINIFAIDDDSFTGFDDSFRVHDANGMDITNTSIILWKGDRYFFKDNRWQMFIKE